MDSHEPKKSLRSYVRVPFSEASTWCLLCSYFSSPAAEILLYFFLTEVPIRPLLLYNILFDLSKLIDQIGLRTDANMSLQNGTNKDSCDMCASIWANPYWKNPQRSLLYLDEGISYLFFHV
jgi:hypothetical protein